jgi:hypothetical protein
MITMTISGDQSVAAKLKRAVQYSQSDAARITNEYGTKLVDLVKMNASGRPGPNVITGMYRGSIRVVERSAFAVTAGTDAPQANRLENGFAGVDALGRSYDQPPFPHWRPALEVIGPQYVEAMREAVRSWWS